MMVLELWSKYYDQKEDSIVIEMPNYEADKKQDVKKLVVKKLDA